MDWLITFLIYAPPVILAITLHEAAHGYAALQRGDATALQAGRLSLNPFKHVDPIGTFALPALLIVAHSPFVFGYAKPVPVNFHQLRNPKRDMVYVAIVGPLTNIALAIFSALLLHTTAFMPAFVSPFFTEMLVFSVQINSLLALFNMLPLPPLDGGRVAVGLLPDRLAQPLARLERYGFLILLSLLVILPIVLNKIGIQFNLFNIVLKEPYLWVLKTILTITGLNH